MAEVLGFIFGWLIGFAIGLPVTVIYVLYKFNRLVANAQVEATGFVSRQLTKYLQAAAMKHVKDRVAQVQARSANGAQ